MKDIEAVSREFYTMGFIPEEEKEVIMAPEVMGALDRLAIDPDIGYDDQLVVDVLFHEKAEHEHKAETVEVAVANIAHANSYDPGPETSFEEEELERERNQIKLAYALEVLGHTVYEEVHEGNYERANFTRDYNRYLATHYGYAIELVRQYGTQESLHRVYGTNSFQRIQPDFGDTIFPEASLDQPHLYAIGDFAEEAHPIDGLIDRHLGFMVEYINYRKGTGPKMSKLRGLIAEVGFAPDLSADEINAAARDLVDEIPTTLAKIEASRHSGEDIDESDPVVKLLSRHHNVTHDSSESDS